MDPTEVLKAITERTVGRSSHFSHPVQLDIEFLYNDGAGGCKGKVKGRWRKSEIVHTSIVQPVQSNKESPLCNLVLMNQDINHCKLCLFTLILGV